MIHLVNMPFASITHPNLALGLMQAQLTRAGLPSRAHNLNLLFGQRIGFGAYERVAMFRGVETQVSEWLFAEQAWRRPFGPPVDAFLALSGEELGSLPHIADPRAWLRRVREQVVPRFIDECVQRIEAAGPVRVVGFSCTFFQTIASLALGRRLKERHPGVKLVYGGACFHGEMGDELIRKVPWIDAVSTGEADDVLVPLFHALDQARAPAGLQGILYRARAPGGDSGANDGGDSDGAVVAGPPHQPVSAAVLDDLPDPVYDDFFADAAEVGLDRDQGWQRLVYLPFESSRGCWWGQKHHCTFCGLNADGMGYRAKSADMVLRTLDGFARRYPTRTFRATDNILATEYFRTLLPRLADKPFGDVTLFYEVKVNMTRAQVKALADAGIRYIQPGIESLSQNLIDQMRKGMTALQNVFFMKCCREYGVLPLWNNLIRIPGERAEDYQQVAAWLPRLVHLWPPTGGSPKVELHRFSPYFAEDGRWTTHRQPSAWYAGLFPQDTIDLARVAYYFDAAWKDTLGGDAYDGVVQGMLDWLTIWRARPELPQLTWHARDDGGLLITDTRGGTRGDTRGNGREDTRREHVLDAAEARVYRAIDAPAKPGQIPLRLADTAGPAVSMARIRDILDDLVARDLALSDGGAYVAIAVSSDTPDVPFDFRQRQFSYHPTNQATNQATDQAPRPRGQSAA